MGEQGPLLQLKDVSVRYGAVTATSGVSLEVREHETVAILGPNGAGKTSTLAAIVGLVPMASGQVIFAGRDISRLPTEQVVKAGITLVREGRKLFGRLTCAENLLLGAATVPRAEIEDLTSAVLDLFPVIKRRLNIQAGLLSGGEQQMLAIARALMSRPTTLLLDEPSLGLAPIIVGQVFDLIASLSERGVTVLLVEQNVERALELADRAYVLSTGTVAMAGERGELSAIEIESAYLGLTAQEASNG